MTTLYFRSSPFTLVPTYDPNMRPAENPYPPITQRLLAQEGQQHALVVRALKTEVMLTGADAPAGVLVPNLANHLTILNAADYPIHKKSLKWDDLSGVEHCTTYYGLLRRLHPRCFTWGYEKNLVQAFQDLDGACKHAGFALNPDNRNMSIPEMLHMYRFLESMAIV